jgi:hypothetical protein
MFIQTHALSCLSNCSFVFVPSSNVFLDLDSQTTCTNETNIELCQGQLVAHYSGRTGPDYFNYTFGKRVDATSKEHVQAVKIHMLNNLTQYQVIIDGNREESTLIVDIYCTHIDQCSWIEMHRIFLDYQQQSNPYYALRSYIHRKPMPNKLFCFDMNNGHDQLCNTSHVNPVCVSYSKDLVQECSSNVNIRIHEQFLVTSPYTVEWNRMSELVQCNTNNCNHIDSLIVIQRLAQDYAFGQARKSNRAFEQRYQIDVLLMFGLVSFIVCL